MKLNKIHLLFALLFLVLIMLELNSANSAFIEYNQIDKQVVVMQEFALDTEDNLIINLPKDASSISSNIPYEIKENQIFLKGKDIKFSYISSELIEKINSDYYLIDKFTSNYNFDLMNILVNLDEGSVINKEDIFPKDFEIKTDGETISINWKITNLKKEDSLALFLKFRNISDNYNLFFISAIIILILILIAVFLFLKKSKKITNKKKNLKKKNKKNKNYENYLLETEKNVIKELKNAERNELWQKQLQLKTGFSKAKLSRIIRNLESRNLIKKIPLGNTNKIILKKI